MRKGLATIFTGGVGRGRECLPTLGSRDGNLRSDDDRTDASCTVPTIAPASFWAIDRGAPTRNTASSKIDAEKIESAGEQRITETYRAPLRCKMTLDVREA